MKTAYTADTDPLAPPTIPSDVRFDIKMVKYPDGELAIGIVDESGTITTIIDLDKMADLLKAYGKVKR